MNRREEEKKGEDAYVINGMKTKKKGSVCASQYPTLTEIQGVLRHARGLLLLGLLRAHPRRPTAPHCWHCSIDTALKMANRRRKRRVLSRHAAGFHISTRRTDRSDRSDRSRSTLDHLDPSLPYWYLVQDLYSTYPTQETCPRSDHADYTVPTRQRELDHTDQELTCSERSESCSGDRWSAPRLDISQVLYI